MPRISPLAKASATLAACAEAVSDANGLNSGTLSNLSSRMKSYSGFGEGVCTCARCMRRAGPIREDVENKLVQITYALANVYDDSPDLEVRVTDEHRARAEEMMACVESGDVTHLREAFLEIEEQESEGLLEGGTATEVATYLIISAAQVGQPEVIRLLAEWDSDMEETDSIRRGRPLMHAANNGHTAAVKALVDCGAEPEATDDNGYTALMVAVFSDRSSAAEALVDGGAAVDAQDRAGRTALSYAAMYGSTDCIYLLAARGADVAHMDTDGNTPLELAEGSGRQSAVDALKKLQLRVKMQEKRKVKQSKCRIGCSDLDAAQLEAKEQEAARAAAELLEQLEKEEAAKTAKAAKKKKKGKGKAAATDCTASDTAETPQQEAVAGMLPSAAANGLHHQQQQHHHHHESAPAQQQQPGSSHSSDATGASWPVQELHDARAPADPGDSAAGKAADGKHEPRKQAKQAASTSPGGSSKQAGADVSSSQEQQQQQHSLVHAATDDTASSVDEAAAGCGSGAAVDDHLDVLRQEWESLLDQAARCRDQQQQPAMLARVAGMLPRCSDAGISVKYGRKVLQRLAAVGPARAALQAALAAQPCSVEELEAALTACKSCRCLLEDDLLQVAEDMLADLLKQQEEQLRLLQQQQQQAAKQLLQQQAQQEAARLAEQQAQLAAEQAQLQQQRQQREQQHQQQQQQQHSLWESNAGPGVGTLAAAESRSPMHRQVNQGQRPVQPQPLLQQQGVPQMQQQQQQQDAMQQQQQQVQQVLQQMSQPMLAPALQRPLQPPPPPPLLQQPQLQQPMPPPQQQQRMAVQHQPPGASMPFLQQQLRAIQPQPQQQQLSLGQLQQHQQLLPQQHPLGAPPASSPLSMSNLLASQQQQHQQHPLGQLQLMQHQQLFASQLQGMQMQRGPMQGGLVGTHPPPMSSMLPGSGGMLSNQLLAPMSQASVRMQHSQQMQQQHQQHQQLAGGYWGAPRPNLVTPGGFGTVGRPLSRSPVEGGRLSLDMLAPSPGLAAAAGELVRRNSLSTPVAVVAPVLLSGHADADVLDDHQHPAYAMANALLSDDDDDDQPFGCAAVECKLCLKRRADACCLPCGCLQMCRGCALLWKQRGELACPWCKAPLEDYAVV